MPQSGLPAPLHNPYPMHRSKPSPTPGPPPAHLGPALHCPQPCQRSSRATCQHQHRWSPQPPPIQARAVGTLRALACTTAASTGSVAGTWIHGQCSGAIKVLKKVLIMFYSCLRFAIASAAISLCKTLIDHAQHLTQHGDRVQLQCMGARKQNRCL